MKNLTLLILVFLSGILSISLCLATESDDLLNSLSPRGMVSDYAQVLGQSEVSSLESTIRAYEQQTGNEMGVAVVDSLKGGDIDDFANKLFAKWGVGKKGKDNGVLLLVAIQDRAARIEVGYGLEPKMTDAVAGRILREQMFPSFKQGRYGEGISLAVDRIISVAKGESPVTSIPATADNYGDKIVQKLDAFEFSFWVPFVVSVLLTFLLGGGIGAKKLGLIIQSSVMSIMLGLMALGSGAEWLQKDRWLYIIFAALVSLIISFFLGRAFPNIFERIENSMASSGGRSSGGGWSSGGGSSGGSFGGGSSGGGGASGRW